MQHRNDGFTLLELLSAIAILAILGAVAVVSYQNYTARAKAADILVQYDALRTKTAVRLADANRAVADCDTLLKALDRTQPLRSEYANLAYAFEATADGYRPVLAVCGKVDAAHPQAARIAREAHNVLSKTASIEPGAVLTDSVVSFALRLTDDDKTLVLALHQGSAPHKEESPCASKPKVVAS